VLNHATYRFIRKYEYAGKPRGYTNSYAIHGPDDALLLYCEVIRHAVRDACPVYTTAAKTEHAFIIAPVRALIVSRYMVYAGATEQVIGSLKRHIPGRSIHWTIHNPDGAVCGHLGDPASLGEQLLRNALDGSPDEYAVIADGQLVAGLKRGAKREPAGVRGLRGLLVKLLTPPDWVLTIHAGQAERIDHRLLIAGVILLHEQDMRIARAAD
jgi:hypothetical protein